MSWTIQNFDDNGFKIPVVPFSINGGGASQQQYLVQLSASAGSHYKTNIELKAGYRVELVTQLKYAGDGGWQWLLDTSDSYRIALLQDGTMDTTGFANVMIDGAPYTGGVLPEPAKLHTISFDCDYDTLVNVLMCKNDVTVFNDNILEILKVYDETGKLIVNLDFKQPPDTQFIPNLASSYTGRDYFNFNGVDQCIDVGDISYTDSLTASMSFRIGVLNGIQTILASDGNGDSLWIYIEVDGDIIVRYRDFSGGFIFRSFAFNVLPNVDYDFIFKYELNQFELSLNGVKISNSALDHQPVSGIRFLASRGNFGFLNGRILNFKINDGSVYNYPVDDGWLQNPRIRNTGSGADATLMKGTPFGWSATQDGAEAVNIPTENYLPVEFDASLNAWVGIDDLWNQPTIVTTGSEPPFSVVGDIKYNLEVGSSYEYKINVVGLTVGVLLLQFGDYNVTIDSSGNMRGVVNSVESNRLRLLVGSTSPSSGASISIEVKRIVEVAQ